MIAQTHKPESVRWDEFKRFHVIHYRRRNGPLIAQFIETGEYLVTTESGGDIDPTYRATYRDFGLEIWRVSDTKLYERFALTHEGERVKQAWLEAHSSAQLLLCDTTCDRAVLLSPGGYTRTTASDTRPGFLWRWGGVYYNVADALPLPTRPIIFSRTLTPTTEQTRHVNALRTAAKAFKVLYQDDIAWEGESRVQLKNESTLGEMWPVSQVAGGKYRDFTHKNGLSVSEILKASTLGDMSCAQIMTLACKGTQRDTADISVPYLDITTSKT